jgi:protein SCO1/2
MLSLPLSLVFGQVTEDIPAELQRMGVDEHSGEMLPLDFLLKDENGQEVQLGDYFKPARPVVLTLFYSDCPMLCSLVLTGLQKAIANVEFRPGVDYQLVSVSIDPKETPERSKAGRERFSENFPTGTPGEAWSFFTADDSTIARVTRTLGFRYFYDEKQKQFAHPAVVFILTPEGKISRYLYGIEYKPVDLRLALLEASEGKIGSTVDKILLYCYHYDPAAKGYVLMAGELMRVGGAVTLVLLAGLYLGMWKRGKGDA